MESRLDTRQPINLKVRLTQKGRTACTADVIDISSYGLGINAPDTLFNNGEVIGVDIIKPGNSSNMSSCIPSVVIHSNAKILGLKLAQKLDQLIFSVEHGLQ